MEPLRYDRVSLRLERNPYSRREWWLIHRFLCARFRLHFTNGVDDYALGFDDCKPFVLAVRDDPDPLMVRRLLPTMYEAAPGAPHLAVSGQPPEFSQPLRNSLRQHSSVDTC